MVLLLQVAKFKKEGGKRLFNNNENGYGGRAFHTFNVHGVDLFIDEYGENWELDHAFYRKSGKYIYVHKGTDARAIYHAERGLQITNQNDVTAYIQVLWLRKWEVVPKTDKGQAV